MCHIQVIIHKLYNSKFSKTKFTDLHYITDENHNDSKFYQRVIVTEVIRKNCVHNLFVCVKILERQCSYIIINTCKSTVAIIKPCTLC